MLNNVNGSECLIPCSGARHFLMDTFLIHKETGHKGADRASIWNEEAESDLVVKHCVNSGFCPTGALDEAESLLKWRIR